MWISIVLTGIQRRCTSLLQDYPTTPQKSSGWLGTIHTPYSPNPLSNVFSRKECRYSQNYATPVPWRQLRSTRVFSRCLRHTSSHLCCLTQYVLLITEKDSFPRALEQKLIVNAVLQCSKLFPGSSQPLTTKSRLKFWVSGMSLAIATISFDVTLSSLSQASTRLSLLCNQYGGTTLPS
jgi:hypothetical protein